MARRYWVFPLFVCMLQCTVVVMSGDELYAALNDSYKLNYEYIYGNGFLYLDMESEELVNSVVFKEGTKLTIAALSEDCNNRIIQISNLTIPGFGSAMHITSSNDNQSYVRIVGEGNFEAGLSASLWIKHSPIVDGNCTILLFGNTDHHLKLKRLVDGNISYVIEYNNDIVGEFPDSNLWDWNMLSFTVNNATNEVLMFDNGALISNKTMSVKLSLLESNIWLNGNGTDGCDNLVVDDLAVWKRVLNMSELIALRVQPFPNKSYNVSCNPGDKYNPTESLKQMKTAIASEASIEAINFHTYVKTVEVLNATDIKDMNDYMDIIEMRNFFIHPKVQGKTQKLVRSSYVEIANSLMKISNTEKYLSDTIDQFSLMMQVEGMANASYLSSSTVLDNENITTDYITLTYASYPQLSEKDNLTLHTDEAKIVIPGTIFPSGESVKAVICVYNFNLSSDFNKFIATNYSNTSVQSNIVSVQINTAQTIFTYPIIMTFPVNVLNKKDVKNTATCSFMDKNMWSKTGVKTATFQNGKVGCELWHLTNFAVLMSVQPIEISDEHNAVLSALTTILITISIICLILAFIILFCLRELDNTQRIQILKHFVAALLCAQLLFVLGTPLFKENKPLCVFVSVLQHYLWLSVFTWMLIQGIQLYTKVRMLAGGHIKQLFYVIFAWGFPLPLCLIPPTFLTDDYIGQEICWIPPKAVYFFAVPAMLIFVVNITVAVMVMNTFLTVKVNKDKSKTEKLKSSMRAVVVMVPILGLTWVFGFLIIIAPNVLLFNYLFAILNPLQGVFVFLFHFVLNEDVRSAVLRRRNKVAASAENTIFTKLPRQRGEQSDGDTGTTKAPLPSDSSTNM